MRTYEDKQIHPVAKLLISITGLFCILFVIGVGLASLYDWFSGIDRSLEQLLVGSLQWSAMLSGLVGVLVLGFMLLHVVFGRKD